MDCREHVVIRVRTCDLEYTRMSIEDALRVRAETACDDDLSVLLECFTNRVERFVDRGVDESAGIDHHQIGGVVIRRDGITFCSQLSEDALRVDERFGAAEADESDFGVFP